jgi:hypothetical protein
MTDEANAVTVKFTLTSSDVFWALAWNTMRKLWFLLLLPIAGVVSIVWKIRDPADSSVNLTSGSICLALGVFFFVAAPYLGALQLRKSPTFSGPVTFSASEQGIELTGEHSNAKLDWSMVKGFSEMNHAILVNLKPAGFQIVPKRQLSQADTAALRNVLKFHAPGKVKLGNA